ncbi:MAG: Y-family DNA polymerase [Firmicutes bacterium]|nr:Y-family DNA polymerase [Bacillota bacterium]
MDQRTYICIDLKSFYASVECVERGLDPLTARLVVADPERTDKTICLAVSPALKALGVPGRCRVFEIPRGIEYIKARPRMQLYIDYSARIYEIYLRYIDKNDIHVYSIDEVFMDVTDYLKMYRMNGRQLAQKIIDEVLAETGITAACGIGTNLYLAKVALDITAKHWPGNISFLDEKTYQQTLWDHRPLTDFWRIGRGIARHLERYGIYTMRQLAGADEKMLFKAFGVDAELLIDHAWGRETATMADIKAYEPKAHSIGSGQVLMEDYPYEKALLVVKEMTDLLCLDLVEKHLLTDSIHLYVGYSKKEMMPGARGTAGLPFSTSSADIIVEHMERLFLRIVQPGVMVRRMSIAFGNTISDEALQCDMFTKIEDLKEEKQMMETMVNIKKKYGKNAILKAHDLEEGATTIERNRQIGGHKA